ncbi:ferrous iron transport protein A [bacterium]|nr:ferrous iron transport protein A [bacterium]
MSAEMGSSDRAESPEREEKMQSSGVQVERVPLSDIRPGQTVKLVHIDGGCTLQSRLATLGLIPGTPIEVVRNTSHGPFVVEVKGSRLVLGRGMANQIMVS